MERIWCQAVKTKTRDIRCSGNLNRAILLVAIPMIGLAVDGVHGLVFYATHTDASQYSYSSISSTEMGSHATHWLYQIADNQAFFITDVVVDQERQQVYWAENGQSSRIRRMNEDGSHVETVYQAYGFFPSALAFDPAGETMAVHEGAGLIDAATAERLRAAEAEAVPEPEPSVPPAPKTGVASSFFGPPVSVVEMFSYLGGAFVLAAWGALITRLVGEASDATRDWILVAGQAVPALVFFILGVAFHGRSPRLSRAAGVSFVLSVSLVQAGATVNAAIFLPDEWAFVVGALVGVLAAAAYRWLHPSVLTEFALLATFTGLVWSWLGVLRLSTDASPVAAWPNAPIVEAAIASIFWVGCAIVIGLLALWESRSGDPEADRRATLARFWAGIVVVVGVAEAVMRTDNTPLESARIIEPWVGELIVVGVSVVLVERAFRRGAGAYVLAAAVGVVIALTDFNFTYIAPAGSTERALLIEGLLLIAIAFGAERLSRRVRAAEPGDPTGPPPTDAVEDDSVAEVAAAAPITDTAPGSYPGASPG
jgi:hypothetical protein